MKHMSTFIYFGILFLGAGLFLFINYGLSDSMLAALAHALFVFITISISLVAFYLGNSVFSDGGPGIAFGLLIGTCGMVLFMMGIYTLFQGII